MEQKRFRFIVLDKIMSFSYGLQEIASVITTTVFKTSYQQCLLKVMIILVVKSIDTRKKKKLTHLTLAVLDKIDLLS